MQSDNVAGKLDGVSVPPSEKAVQPDDAHPASAARVRPSEAESCAVCGSLLARRGPDGSCLRCALLAAFGEDETAADEAVQGEEARAAPSGTPTVIRRYGHFEVARGFDGQALELGSGAMATTYRATDTVLGTMVALKVISQSVAGQPAARARFLREARAAARLHHPNVSSVSHYGEEAGECFYAMELVEGETLAERVRRLGPLPPDQTMEVGVQVARALAAAEAVGVVHRDLKPSNLMLVSNELLPGREPREPETALLHVKVIDWGLAKAVSADDALLGADHTREGGFVGTPAFASPEQFGGRDGQGAERERIDVRSDIYSLGVTLWYLLCGKAPFVGDTLDAIHARQRTLPLEHLRNARVPAALTALLRAMLAFDPAERPQSARELLEQLRLCQEHFVLHSPERVRRRRRRLACVLALLLVLGVGAVLWRWRQAQARSAGTPEKLSLAVLPFENLSPDPADAFFATGVQDETTNGLAHLAAFNVLSAASTRAYSPGRRDFPRIGAELGARYLLEGSVRRSADEVQIDVRLVDLHTPDHPWSERYTRHLSDVFALQGEITRAVAARLHGSLSDAEKAVLDQPPTSDLAAYDLYRRVHGEIGLPASTEQEYRYLLDTGVPLLEQALGRDPKFFLAYCDLAYCYDRLTSIEASRSQGEAASKYRDQAEEALTHASLLRPDAGEVHLARAQHAFDRGRKIETVLQELAPARRELPNSVQVERLAGRINAAQGRWEEAMHSFEKIALLDPRNPACHAELANAAGTLRRYEQANREWAQVIALSSPRAATPFRMRQAISRLEGSGELAPLQAVVDGITPADAPPASVMTKARLILALYGHDAARATALLVDIPPAGLVWLEDPLPKAWFEALAARLRHDDAAARDAFARARPEVERLVVANAGNGRLLGVLAMIDAGLGRKEEAVREGIHACELCPVDKAATAAPVVACDSAVVYAWTGQPGQACETLKPWINRFAGEGMVKQATYGDLLLNPVWDPLRGNPEFEALVAQLAPTPASPTRTTSELKR